MRPSGLKTGKPESIEETGYYADPSATHTMLVQKAPLRDRHGHISGTISVAVEITELKNQISELTNLVKVIATPQAAACTPATHKFAEEEAIMMLQNNFFILFS